MRSNRVIRSQEDDRLDKLLDCETRLQSDSGDWSLTQQNWSILDVTRIATVPSKNVKTNKGPELAGFASRQK